MTKGEPDPGPTPNGDRSSSGDIDRVLRLLWRRSLAASDDNRRGPSRKLDVDAIVNAAIHLCDADGSPNLTMRILAGHLSVKPMTLYTYIPGRAELFDLMVDHLYEQMPRPSFHVNEPWLKRVRDIADRNRDMYLKHPWLAGVSTTRPPLGPGQMAKYDYELHAFDHSGLDDLETDDALTLVLTFVKANARDTAASQADTVRSGTNDTQWWAQVKPLFARVFDPDRHPLAARIGTASGTHRGSALDPGHAYDFGLTRVLSALELLANDSRQRLPEGDDL